MKTTSDLRAAEDAVAGKHDNFERNGVLFWLRPVIYRIGETRFNEKEFDRFLEDFGFEIREDQFCGDPGENVIEAAGRSCYLSYEPEVHGRDQHEYLRNIRESDHGSVVRHASATWTIVGVSRGLTHELVRHATGTAISQSSSRYIHPRRLGFVVPHEIQHDYVLREDFVEESLARLDHYDHVMAHLQEKRSDLNVKQRRGVAREYLPIGLAQVITMTWNVQSMRHLLRMRGNVYAEAQIVKLAGELANEATNIWPELLDDVTLGPDGKHIELGPEV